MNKSVNPDEVVSSEFFYEALKARPRHTRCRNKNWHHYAIKELTKCQKVEEAILENATR